MLGSAARLPQPAVIGNIYVGARDRIGGFEGARRGACGAISSHDARPNVLYCRPGAVLGCARGPCKSVIGWTRREVISAQVSTVQQGQFRRQPARPEDITRRGKQITQEEAMRIMTELQTGRTPIKK